MKQIVKYHPAFRSSMVRGLFLVTLLATASCLSAQSFTGKWAGSQRTLANGESDVIILQLTQTGIQVTGTIKTLSFQGTISGTATGSHLQLMSPRNPQRQFAAGDLVGTDLHMTMRRRDLVLKPATAADDIPTPAYIAPPALKKIESNGLAKTPPMGWNS